MKKIPHVIPYQGSKRKLAPHILSYINFEVDILYEPFVGSGAITLAAATNNKANHYVIADKLAPLAELWKLLVNSPDVVAVEYNKIWSQQLDDPSGYFKTIREKFNADKDPIALLYLIARCVKNAVRFNNNGEFNQGADNRRLGMNPEKVRNESLLLSSLLKGKIDIYGTDYKEVIKKATPNDLIYMDPPWQGTSGKKDPRYAFLLNIDDLIESLNDLNVRNIPYILSFDGICGDKNYGQDLPRHLGLKKVMINAGRSSQATLLGRKDMTIESLYLSPSLLEKYNNNKSRVTYNTTNNLEFCFK
ncbi:DNA adenine methylase [Atlantibacter sp.]|uniref:DNA adenine methylase n=1 Tax=Atlantibacter sp. TaxID=1903473 RepID=UPI002898B1CF|nr:DNA adenine methylase [Atlantibacter sp.]